jgi:hypothetical protein
MTYFQRYNTNVVRDTIKKVFHPCAKNFAAIRQKTDLKRPALPLFFL